MMRYADDAAVAECRRRRADRLRPVRLLVQSGVVGVRQALLPEHWRGVALGAGTAAGSFGQFLFAPFGVAMIDNFGWQTALTVFAGLMLLIVPLSLALATPAGNLSRRAGARTSSRSRQALAEAFGHRSYVLLVLGFFTCGFQLAFITVHLPAYLVDRGISRTDRRLGDRRDRPVQHHRLARRRLARKTACRSATSCRRSISCRALSIVAFISFPITPSSAIMFGADHRR